MLHASGAPGGEPLWPHRLCIHVAGPFYMRESCWTARSLLHTLYEGVRFTAGWTVSREYSRKVVSLKLMWCPYFKRWIHIILETVDSLTVLLAPWGGPFRWTFETSRLKLEPSPRRRINLCIPYDFAYLSPRVSSGRAPEAFFLGNRISSVSKWVKNPVFDK